jgi:hypothetical protein
MSQWVSMTVLPAEAFARLQADGDAVASQHGESFDLHPLWYNFHELFRDDPGPLRFIVQGDIPEGRSLEWCLGLEEGKEDEEADGTYFAYVSPVTVTAIATALPAWPRWRVFEKLRKAHPDWLRYKKDREEFAAAYDQLVQIYEVAAKQGAALEMLVC